LQVVEDLWLPVHVLALGICEEQHVKSAFGLAGEINQFIRTELAVAAAGCLQRVVDVAAESAGRPRDSTAAIRPWAPSEGSTSRRCSPLPSWPAGHFSADAALEQTGL
jgi:hypothetical protein